MADKYLGFTVSVECRNNAGSYQGQITKVDPGLQVLTLSKAFHNGFPASQSEIQILASQIANLSIISKPSDNVKKEPKPVKSSLSYKMSKQANTREMNESPQRKSRGKVAERDEACFFTPINMKEDFDFEGNLALFDKKGIMGDLKKSSQGNLPRSNSVQNYRHDENVIETAPPVYRQIRVPYSDAKDFYTDSSLVVPSISAELRLKLENLLHEQGFTSERRSELTARSVAEVALQLVGGPHRLTPKNAHQKPVVAVVCGAYSQAAAAVCSARHLATLGLRTSVYLQAVPSDPNYLKEIALYQLTEESLTCNLAEMPQNVDLIIACLLSPTAAQPLINVQAVVEWANRKRAPVLALDQPPATSVSMATQWLDIKCTLAPELPLNYSERDGKLYLYSLGIPRTVYKKLGIAYESPFGSKCVITIHPAP